MEHFCIGLVIGVLLARVQPSLWAIVNKWRKKEPVIPTPVVDAHPTVPMKSKPVEPVTVVDSPPVEYRMASKRWTFEARNGRLLYELIDHGGIEPTLIATIYRQSNDMQGYWHAWTKRGFNATVCGLTFEKACEHVNTFTGARWPKPLHLSMNRND